MPFRSSIYKDGILQPLDFQPEKNCHQQCEARIVSKQIGAAFQGFSVLADITVGGENPLGIMETGLMKCNVLYGEPSYLDVNGMDGVSIGVNGVEVGSTTVPVA